MPFKEQLKEYFTFTKGEIKGITVLLVILFVIILANIFSGYFIEEKKYNFSGIEQLLEKTEYSDSAFANSDKNSKLFNFNPNFLSEKEAEDLGFSEYQYEMIQKYLNSGGKFYIKSDLKKIYSVNENLYLKLEPYIDLPEKNKPETEKKQYETPQKKEYFTFNPNTLNDEGWKKLGFSEKQISVIRNFINKGGKFYKKQDLKKLYVINDKKYLELEPYIEIPQTENYVKEKQKRPKVDINNLSAEEMKKYGKFWQYNAERIVKYRNLLGGYYKKEQLLEVYGVKKQYYDKIAGDIIVDKSKLEKININFAEISELGRHPYISYENAEKIIEYRNKNGFINDLKILKSKHIIPPDLYDKISPYLKVK